ncbi:MAG: nucleotidyltransferase [Candidatus Limnocylindria bacterium]
MPGEPPPDGDIGPDTRAFYRRILQILSESGTPFLVGGALAFEHYTGIERNTRDLDVFLRPMHRDQALERLDAAGEETEASFPHWLAKVRSNADYVDLIFSSGNGLAEVDAEWFDYSTPATILDIQVDICPVEEMIWSKAFVMERERYDGADVIHLIRACAAELDWDRLLGRFGAHWRVLLSHLVLFGFVYPGDRPVVPPRLLRELVTRLEREAATRDPGAPACLGTLISRQQYVVDLERWGYRDGRLPPTGRMTKEEIEAWTAAMLEDERRERLGITPA